jgi:ADYC domain
MKTMLVVWSLAIVGCMEAGRFEVPDDPLTEVAGEPPGGVAWPAPPPAPPPGGELQGRRLLGSFADGLATTVHFRVAKGATNRSVSLAVSGAELVARNASGAVVYAGANLAFVGLQLAGIDGGELKIDGVTSFAPGVTLYALSYRATPTTGWSDYCAGEGSAVPMQGAWTALGLHTNGPTITFGCEAAALVKCTEWGYVAGNGGPRTGNWDHHQACTQMVRAAYCGDGISHTLDLTPIVIRDFIPGAEPALPPLVHPTSLPAPPDQFFFEAGWRADNLPPVCLSKTRWASQPLGGHCAAGVLPDPRVSNLGQFCDDLHDDVITGRGAILLNASLTNDAYLNRWSNGSDVISTIRGFASTLGDAKPPFPGYTTFLGTDGILLRNPPGSISKADLRAVYQLYNPTTGDRVVGYPSVPGVPGPFSTYLTGDFEGWTFNSAVVDPGLPTRTAFGMYQKGDDFVSTIGPATGYTSVAPMSYVTTP